MPRLIVGIAASVALFTLLPRPADGYDFGGVGVGTQVLVVDGEQGNETGFGIAFRTRFLWILGLELSATKLDSSEDVWGVSPYRIGLMIHAIQTEYVQVYLSPGLAGQSLLDAFNPVGETTWYRIGGGIEFRIIEGLRIGGDVHWTLPGERQTERYVEENGEALLAEYLAAMGADAEVPSNVSELRENLSTSELLDLLPLDRFEFTVGLRYYF